MALPKLTPAQARMLLECGAAANGTPDHHFHWGDVETRLYQDSNQPAHLEAAARHRVSDALVAKGLIAAPITEDTGTLTPLGLDALRVERNRELERITPPQPVVAVVRKTVRAAGVDIQAEGPGFKLRAGALTLGGPGKTMEQVRHELATDPVLVAAQRFLGAVNGTSRKRPRRKR